MKRLIEDEKGVSTIIGFMFILASIVLYASVAYPAMIKKDIKNAESEAIDNIESKMLIFSDDIQSNRTGQISFQLKEVQRYSSTSTAAMVFSPNDETFSITITTPTRGSLPITPGTLTIKPKNIFAEDRTMAFQAGVVIEQQGRNPWSNAASFLSISGRNVSAQIPIITGDYFSVAGGIKTLKYSYNSTIHGAFQDTHTGATIEIETPYPLVFETIFKNDMKKAGFTSPTDYSLTNTTNSVTLNLYNLDAIGIDTVHWTVK
jgi:hypothetical protein